jgi:hypothetical protein
MNFQLRTWIAIFVASTIAGFIPELWGSDLLSLWGVLFSGLGAFVGLWWAKRDRMIDPACVAFSGGVALCGELTKLGLRLANRAERGRYRETIAAGGHSATVFLVDIDSE